MKKLILITGILLSTSVWGDMDNICSINLFDEEVHTGVLEESYYEYIESNCDRDNILVINGLVDWFVPIAISSFCRYDRNVTEHLEIFRDGFKITCVLYDSKPREQIK